VLRRGDVRTAILANRRVAQSAVDRAIDELLTVKNSSGQTLLCQQEDGSDLHLHWCFHDDYQGEKVRKGRGSPLFEFTCPNEKRVIVRDTARDSAIPRGSAPYIDIDIDKDIDKDKTKTDPPVVPPVRGDRTRTGKPRRHRPMNDPETAERLREIPRMIMEAWPDHEKLCAARASGFDVRHKTQAEYESDSAAALEQKGTTG
jgi:hypothetical protein